MVIASTLLCHVSYQRYHVLAGDSTLETERLNKPEKKNVHFLQGTSPKSLEEFSSFRTNIVQALHNINLNGKVLMNYENKYKVYERKVI